MDPTPLVLRQAVKIDGKTFGRGTTVATMGADEVIRPVEGVTRGNVVALRRRGMVNEGPLTDKPATGAGGGEGEGGGEGTPLPDDFPGRAALAAADVLTFESLRAVEDLTKLNGIGGPTAERIAQALTDKPATGG